MARIKLEMPEAFHFQTALKVRITDLNYGGHVANEVILGMMHESRMQYLWQLGYTSEIDSIEGYGLIQTDAAIVYKSETFYGETLLVEIAAVDVTKYGFDFVYKFSKSDKGEEVARGKTGLVCFDYESRKMVPIPLSFKEKIQP